MAFLQSSARCGREALSFSDAANEIGKDKHNGLDPISLFQGKIKASGTSKKLKTPFFKPFLYVGTPSYRRGIKTIKPLNYSTCTGLKKIENPLDPWWVTGFTDAEASFYVAVSKDSKQKLG